MNELRLEGLVLASRPLGENDRLLSVLTREEGLLRFAACFWLIEADFAKKRKSYCQ